MLVSYCIDICTIITDSAALFIKGIMTSLLLLFIDTSHPRDTGLNRMSPTPQLPGHPPPYPEAFFPNRTVPPRNHPRTNPPYMPHSIVTGHFCHSRSQSSGMGTAPSQAPTQAPTAPP